MEYEIIAFDTGKEPFVDNHGNTWCTVAFQGISEPVRWVVKDPTKYKIGDMVYGKITQETSKAGKPYNRFRKESPSEGLQKYAEDVSQDKPSAEYWDNKQRQIKAQWAIGQAVQLGIAGSNIEEIEVKAKELFSMVDRIANPIDENAVDIVNLNDIPL